MSLGQVEMNMVVTEDSEKMLRIRTDGWEIMRCTDGEITVTKTF